MTADPKVRRAAGLKAAKLRADRRAGVGQEPAQTPPPPPPLQQHDIPVAGEANTLEENGCEREEDKEEL
ncbi:hypothetical protein MMC31_007601, partial [Peltigera leucophlebia]|nr:hypothetical protein [Peltigera leucophlebia]